METLHPASSKPASPSVLVNGYSTRPNTLESSCLFSCPHVLHAVRPESVSSTSRMCPASDHFSPRLVPWPSPVQATPVSSLLFLRHTEATLTSGPLHLFFPMLGTPFPHSSTAPPLGSLLECPLPCEAALSTVPEVAPPLTLRNTCFVPHTFPPDTWRICLFEFLVSPSHHCR